MKTAQADRLRVLLDKQEIIEVLSRYARGVDRCDRSCIESVFFPDAKIVRGDVEIAGADMADKVIARVRETYDATFHQVTNFIIDVCGDEASSESYVVATETFHDNGCEFTRTRGLRWIDRFERRAGVWGIAGRVAVGDWARLEANSLEVPFVDELEPGQRSPDDASYSLRRSS